MTVINEYERLKEELARTGVISSEFKAQLLGHGMAIASWAYKRGEDAERKRWIDSTIERTNPS